MRMFNASGNPYLYRKVRTHYFPYKSVCLCCGTATHTPLKPSRNTHFTERESPTNFPRKGKMKNEAAEGNLGYCLSEFLDDGSIESHRYYLARRTVLEMLKDRGFVVPNSNIEVSLQEFRNKHGQNPDVEGLRISALRRDDHSIKALVIFCGPGVVKVNTIRAIWANLVNKDTLSRMILIVQDKITSQAKKDLEVFPFKVEIFQIADLLVNITKHELKPKHQVLTDEEKEDTLKKYSIDEKQLPRMSTEDAIARYYGLEKGQVVKVSYSGELTQLHVTHRCVW